MTAHRTRGWNKRETPRVSVTVRFEPDEIALIDSIRGCITRQDLMASAVLVYAQQQADKE